ncbi:unnamed protein product [Bursaphelenchus okinawaensis]|uniref:Uncharacterized protein n=1 Tax=Bursaphelenchus okinawaensis TaxID=465554 RepID=A0A811LD67_9BILA|nr:unnamed protein product [Bursaphelenchus okinawaensis]CAG9121138.1 unnamed protein product [Bursaphelenchus okinawaensis]
MKERASDAYDEVKDRAEELKDSVLGATQSNEERFEHEVGHRADELAECIDDQCTCDVLGASGELFHHCRQ